ncbi:trigger factor [Buchnera aphidicola (Acyrthosiphon lactucae)]|uniref:Trigger factor n=1 Tax=Buchnera aphidicola (Acyrthosiphon lactucae) TaxID=1241832 RepID=A0A4D6XZB4_9GAMM|nr:trigger factor [Buchnera aphidicola]QCI17855.1 trigger factor [Buchnera aphidicola (Acyrthosiphon lactucae)]
MKFFMEKNKDAGHRVTIKIPKTTVNSSIIKECIRIGKTTKINGFRKGKTPIKVIQEKYGYSIYYDTFKKLMQNFFYEFINKEKIKIIGSPKFYMHQNKEKEKEYFEYHVIYELYPKFKIEDIKKIKVNKINVKITDQDINKNIEKYKIKKNVWNTVNQAIKSHDRVTINYYVYEKNINIKKFNTENISFIVSENTLIPQLNYKIINHFINDIFFFKIKFHQFYPEKELQNKDITFKIKILKIEKKEEIEENKKDNKKDKLTQLNYQNIKNNLCSQINVITEQYLEDQFIKKIIEKNIILIPPLLFQQEIKNLYRNNKKKYKEENSSILEKKYHFDLNSQVKKKLYIQIIIQKIISDNQLCSDKNNIQKIIEKISLNYKNPKEIINLYNKNNNFKNTIKNIDLENQAMLLLKKSIQIKKKYWTFDQFINYNWKNHEEIIL